MAAMQPTEAVVIRLSGLQIKCLESKNKLKNIFHLMLTKSNFFIPHSKRQGNTNWRQSTRDDEEWRQSDVNRSRSQQQWGWFQSFSLW